MSEGNFEGEIPHAPQPDDELKKIINEQMCVVRSLASVATAYTKTEIGLDPDIVQRRAIEINGVTTKANTELQETLGKWQKEGGQSSVFRTNQLIDQVTKKYASQDTVNVRKLIDSVITDESLASSLKEGLHGTVARYKNALSYADVSRALHNPNNQVCVVIPGHMAHVALDEKGEIVSLSDKDKEGKPIPLGGNILFSFITGNQNYSKDTFNTVIFTREERIPRDVDASVNENFLDVSHEDNDYQKAVRQVQGVSGQTLYPPDPYKVDEGIYPEAETYREEREVTGPLHPQEAIAAVHLARKGAILSRSFGQSHELSSKVGKLYHEKASDLGISDLPDDIWQHDTADGITQFLRELPTIAFVRESSGPAKPADENNMTIRELDKKRYSDLYYQSLQADQGLIGRNTIDSVVRHLSERAEEDIPRIPEGARTPEEIQARIASRKLGLHIAKDFYLKSLAMQQNEDKP